MSIESIESRRGQYEKILEDWSIHELIGSGSSGKTGVFRITKNQEFEEIGALKVVNIVEVDGDLDKIKKEIREDYEQERDIESKEAIREVETMYKLRDCPHVMRYLGRKLCDWKNDSQFGRDLLILMDYNKTIWELAQEHPLDEATVIQIGIDACKALVVCQQVNIIHRDIKPTNIFVDTLNHYLLGDFGIARIVKDSYNATTRKGTDPYAAPEQYFVDKHGYDNRVDIYSLGLTLYVLCNKNNLPFKTHEVSLTTAVQLRLRGDAPLTPPCEASDELSKIILKACAYRREDRYQSAQEFLEELEELQWQRTDFHKSKKTFRDQLRALGEDSVSHNAGELPQSSEADKLISDAKLGDESTHFCSSEIDKDPFKDMFEIFGKFDKKDASTPQKQAGSTSPISQNPAQMRESSDEIPCESIAKDFMIENGVLVKYCGHDENVVLPEGIVEIGEGAFEDCSQLKSISIGAGVEKIGVKAFQGCRNLASIILPNSVTYIGFAAFYFCVGLTSVAIPNSVTYIEDSAFSLCASLTSVAIPNSVTYIGHSAFSLCSNLVGINVASGNPKYSSVDGVLFNADQTLLHTYPLGKREVSYCIPFSVTSIGSSAFIQCRNLTSVTIPSGVTSIGDFAFYQCRNLTSVSICNSVTYIEYAAFECCDALKDVYYGGSENQWRQIVISESGNESLTNATIHYNSLTKTELERTTDDLLRSAGDEKIAQSNSKPANSIQETQDIKSNNLDSDLDNIITLNDQDGNSVQFEFLDLVEYRGKEYAVLLPISEDSEDDSANAVIILEVINTGKDEDSYVTIDNEEDLQAVFNIFKERFKEEFNFVD